MDHDTTQFTAEGKNKEPEEGGDTFARDSGKHVGGRKPRGVWRNAGGFDDGTRSM